MLSSSPGSLDLAESALQSAQMQSDVEALDALLHPDVVYVAPDGSQFSKEQDLESHRSGQLRITRLDQLDRRTREFGQAGVTITRVQLAGIAGGTPFEAEMVYTRTWLFDDDRWQVIQAQGAIAT